MQHMRRLTNCDCRLPNGGRSGVWFANAWVSIIVLSCIAWSEPTAEFRRSIQIAQDEKQINGDETAMVSFLAPDRLAEDGSDLRVAADNGTLVPMTVIRSAADDRVVLIFNPAKGNANYFVYWGDKGPKKAAPSANVTSGLLVEMKRPARGAMGGFEQMEKLYNRSGDVIARGMMDRMFGGYNPGGVEGETLSRITGTIFAPLDGEYQLALTADDRGAIRIDGKHTLFAPGSPEDIRFNTKIQLKRGSHTFEYFHHDAGGDWRVTLGWRRPDTPRIDVVAADAFGRFAPAKVGDLERRDKPVTAGMEMHWVGECFVEDRSAYRVRLTANYPARATNVRAEWDLGDGQKASGSKIEHVFLAPGRYEITLDLRTSLGHDKRVYRLDIGRDPTRPVDPATDSTVTQAPIVANYDFGKLNSPQQAMAVRLLARGKAHDALMPAVRAMCATARHADQAWAYDTLVEAAEIAIDKKRAADLAEAMSVLPTKSNLHPKAADLHADLLLWYVADFQAAEKMLSAFRDRPSPNLKRLHMKALLLEGRVAEAKKLLAELPPHEEVGRRVAISGAMARTIEYFIDNNEPDSAADKWDDWQRRYPESFWEGYSAVLKVRMLERSYPVAAAKIAEAFAKAVPDSAYAPQLLDRASNILAKSDAKKSDELRKLLKERYPEDPLSQ